jgi:hypothetical protein
MEISEQVLESLRTEWIDIGFSTGDVDVEKAKPYIEEIYRNGKFDPPEFYFVVSSPIELLQYKTVLETLDLDVLRKSNDPYKLVAKKAKKITNIKLDYEQICFGNHDAASLAFYDYFVRYEHVDGIEPIVPFIELAKVCGWWIPLDGAVILTNLPTSIKKDDEGRLHCDNGPAISYDNSDFEVYIWHGVRIPPEWIRDKSLTAEQALKHPQIEQRRAACEILGWHNVLEQLNSIIIDDHDDEEIGTLIEVEIPDIGTERFLKVKCGTGRIFAIPVPPDIKTALEANAWTYGVAANDYIPEIRT